MDHWKETKGAESCKNGYKILKIKQIQSLEEAIVWFNAKVSISPGS